MAYLCIISTCARSRAYLRWSVSEVDVAFDAAADAFDNTAAADVADAAADVADAAFDAAAADAADAADAAAANVVSCQPQLIVHVSYQSWYFLFGSKVDSELKLKNLIGKHFLI